MMEVWRGTGDPRVASPIIYKGQRKMGIAASGRGKVKGRIPVPWEVWEPRPANGDGQDRAHALG